MRTTVWGVGCAIVFCLVMWAFSGPSDAEVDANQNAQCLRWGAHFGSSDYIQCRATLAVNYQREKDSDSNSAVAGVAFGMAAGAAGRR